jgi:hypothetical protein
LGRRVAFQESTQKTHIEENTQQLKPGIEFDKTLHLLNECALDRYRSIGWKLADDNKNVLDLAFFFYVR